MSAAQKQPLSDALVARDDKKIKSVDVAVLVGCTLSMTPYINNIRTKISQIVDEVHKTYPDWAVRSSFIGYYDYDDEDKYPVHVPFTENRESFSYEISGIQSLNGVDYAEDVLSGLEAVGCDEMGWESKVKIVIHFGDAPCHGALFHTMGASGDNHLHQDPEGSLARKAIATLAQKRIDYYFARISGDTDQMVELFRRWYEEERPNKHFEQLSVNDDPAKFVAVVSSMVSKSITRSLSGNALR